MVVPKSSLNVRVFHDERYIGNQWLYHGYLVVEDSCFPELKTWQQACRQAVGRPDKAVHFKELTSRSSSQTKLAIKWVQCLDNGLCNMARFYLLGIDLGQLDRKKFGLDAKGKALDTRVYNRFFHMGMYSGLRWFFPHIEQVVVRGIYSEHRDLHEEDGFCHQAPYHINKREANIVVVCENVTMVPAKAADGNRCLLDCLQMTDVFTGACSQILDHSNRKDGCVDVAGVLRSTVDDILQNHLKTGKPWYKRFAISFFPEKPPGNDVDKWGEGGGGMYNYRHIKMPIPGQDEFDLGI